MYDRSNSYPERLVHSQDDVAEDISEQQNSQEIIAEELDKR